MILAVLLSLGSFPIIQAAGLGLLPGLWEVRLVKQSIDGHDISAQLTESVAKGETALSKLTPAARDRAQQTYRHSDPGSNASFRVCLNAQLAARNLPILDQEGRCRPVAASRNGQVTAFRIDCTADGNHIKGEGQSRKAGKLIVTQTTVRTRAPDGSAHTMRDTTQMQFLGADCGKQPALR